MPYTPPAQSPLASRAESPTLSRNHSYVKFQQQALGSGQSPPSSPRPGLPRSMSSTSYLHRHRRSPSMQSPSSMFKGQSADLETQVDTTLLESFGEKRSITNHGSSVRQSPPPVNDLSMPTGAVISPPDSAQNSSDDEELGKSERVRSLENLAELQAAISIIEQRREGSPDEIKQEQKTARMALGLVVPDENSDTFGIDGTSYPQPRFSKETRKIQHSRSVTESSLPDLNRSEGMESPDRSSDSDLEEEARFRKPPMLRKKSGELVRPALRPTYSKRRPSSMPGTPTYSKAVHFDSHLEHVRHFLQVDKPLAVSANSSPVETYDGEMEFPFGTGGRSREQSWQWEIKLPNFPRSSFHRSHQPVHVERVFLSSDCKTLIGTVVVQNLSFHKKVIARFTLDHWKTTSEVTAEYNNDATRPQDNTDMFNFNIKLEDLANLENKTLLFCVRYNVNGQEYWDSNNDVNFQVNFSKKATSHNAKQVKASRPLNALPRSRPSPPTSAGKPRPKSTPSFDDFAQGFDQNLTSFPPPVLNDTPIRFKNRPSIDSSPAPLRTKAPSQAFGNRYDFGASLSAAIQAASSSLGDRSGIQASSKTATSSKPTEVPQRSDASAPIEQMNGGIQTSSPTDASNTSSGTSALKSQSYNEILDKYCFFGSAKVSSIPSKPGNGQLGGGGDIIPDRAPIKSEFDVASPPTSHPATSTSLKVSIPAVPVPVSSASRSSSPPVAIESRTTLPLSFGYPYHQTMQSSMFQETPTTTAIHG